ncbi:ATP-binding cassette domain-containing protein, partial [Deinococcus pimensis]|uniref:ATP-binding cassette domain-containing protein n=1 Tax=Deinococcus pimensis TaxID=309888 RepID=UPI0005EB0A12
MSADLPLVRLSDVSVTVDGREALVGVSWTLRRGETWAVTGPNGAGKSTFFRVVAGLTWPSSGERTYGFSGRETRSPLAARERVALVSPEASDWYLRHDWALTAAQVVTSGVTRTPLPAFPAVAAHETRARAVLAELGLSHLSERDVRTLSQGQRRRVLLARALAGSPDVLVLDEFFEGVDAASRADLRAVVAALGGSG